MDDGNQFKLKLLFICGVVVTLVVLCLGTIITLSFARDRQAGRYPGALSISSHSNYKSLPFGYRWDDSYLTTDNFTAVYNWYSITFDLGAESRAIGKCTLLEGAENQLILKRYISVFVCNTPDGQMVFVTRSTSLR
jgi:hypothetical protein